MSTQVTKLIEYHKKLRDNARLLGNSTSVTLQDMTIKALEQLNTTGWIFPHEEKGGGTDGF